MTAKASFIMIQIDESANKKIQSVLNSESYKKLHILTYLEFKNCNAGNKYTGIEIILIVLSTLIFSKKYCNRAFCLITQFYCCHGNPYI